MRENINKVSQRGERLDSLQDKTDNLAVSAQGFRRGANRVRKQMWWKDMKMRMCLIAGIIILIIVIVVPAGVSSPVTPSAGITDFCSCRNQTLNYTSGGRVEVHLIGSGGERTTGMHGGEVDSICPVCIIHSLATRSWINEGLSEQELSI
jgi:hypothetical protein